MNEGFTFVFACKPRTATKPRVSLLEKTEKQKNKIQNKIHFFKSDARRKFQWLSRQKWQCPIYNSTLWSFVWSSMNCISKSVHENWISSNCGFSAKVTWAFLLQKNHEIITEFNTFPAKKDYVSFHIIDWIKVSWVPLRIRHVPF